MLTSEDYKRRVYRDKFGLERNEPILSGYSMTQDSRGYFVGHDNQACIYFENRS